MKLLEELRIFGWRELRSRYAEKAAMAVAWRVPRWLAYWCFIRVWANATTGEFGNVDATSVNATDCLKAWDKKA